MQDLDKALSDISAMRTQIARGTEFRGYGPVTVAATAVRALAAGAAQAWLVPQNDMFSLGLFASCRALPRAVFAAAVWYLAAGLANLAFAGAEPFSPWAMALPFALGQAFIAVVLYRNLGAHDGEN
jgi:hypothetical protein